MELASKEVSFSELVPSMLVSLVVFPSVLILSLSTAFSSPDEQYVYYGYIPPSVANLSRPVIPVGDVIAETIRNYTSVPANLDIVGIEDSTSYQLYDLSTKTLLRSGSLSKYEHVRIQFGSRRSGSKPFEVQDYYIKLVTDKPVSALLTGGLFREEGTSYGANATICTLSDFVPSVDGGPIGKEFIFLTFPTYWQPSKLIDESNTWHIFATQDSKVNVYDAGGSLVQELNVAKLSMSRTQRLEPYQVYRVTSTGNILVYGTSLNSMVYVPALTGGYVGNWFLATRPGIIQFGDLQSLIVVAMQDAKVQIYDMRKPAGSSPDKVLEVKQGEMAFDTSLQSNLAYMVRSTGNITLLWGGNIPQWGTTFVGAHGFVTAQNIADDITFIGARPGQEVGFFAPYQAVVFAAGDTDLEVNGIPRSMKKDEFITLPTGTSTVKPSSSPVIIEILGNANVIAWTGSIGEVHRGFENWGSYLKASQALYKSYRPPEEGVGLELLLYVGIGAVAVVAVFAVAVMLRRRNKA